MPRRGSAFGRETGLVTGSARGPERTGGWLVGPAEADDRAEVDEPAEAEDDAEAEGSAGGFAALASVVGVRTIVAALAVSAERGSVDVAVGAEVDADG